MVEFSQSVWKKVEPAAHCRRIHGRGVAAKISNGGVLHSAKWNSLYNKIYNNAEVMIKYSRVIHRKINHFKATAIFCIAQTERTHFGPCWLIMWLRFGILDWNQRSRSEILQRNRKEQIPRQFRAAEPKPSSRKKNSKKYKCRNGYYCLISQRNKWA